MGTFGKWIWGIIILGILAFLINWFAPAPWGARANSVNMGKSVETALQAGGFKGVVSTMSGNVAKLTGTTISDQRKQAAIDTAQNAKCEKCADSKKRWHVVNADELNVKKVVATVKPYTLTGVRTDDGGILLNGYVHDDAERLAVLAEAERLFPDKVTDRTIKIAQGAPDANWKKIAFANLAGLAALENGEFGMTDWDSFLTGKASTGDVRSAINTSIEGLGGRYNGATNITVPNMAAVNTGQIKSESVCQGLFDKLKGDNKVNFAYNRAEIRGAPSVDLLNTLASAATQCSTFRVSVEGHTDADGSDVYNKSLSQRRADAVVSYLIANGVDVANVSAIGYGETNPIASNDTPQGMAQNRRIEFKVTRSK